MSSEGTEAPSVHYVNPLILSSAEQSANQRPIAPVGQGRNVELVDAHGNLVQIPVGNLRFVTPNANVVPTTTPLEHDDTDHAQKVNGPASPGQINELRKCCGSLYRCDCTPDQLWKATVTVTQRLLPSCTVIMAIAILCLFISAWAIDELAYSNSGDDDWSTVKCGWIEFKAEDEWDDYNISKRYKHVCYGRNDYHRGTWCRTLSAAVSSLIFTLTASLLTVTGLVRTKWQYCCCKCPAFMWFLSATLFTVVSILAWVAGDDLCLSHSGNDYLYDEYDIYSRDFKLGQSMHCEIAASALLGVLTVASLCSWCSERKEKQKVIAHRAANLAPSASGPRAPMMEGIHQL